MKKMGTKLATGRGKNLYEYWGASVAEELGSRLQAIESDDERFLVNIASAECKPLTIERTEGIEREEEGRLYLPSFPHLSPWLID